MENNKKMLDDIQAFQNAGFRLTNKDELMLGGSGDFDPHSPDVVLIAQNDVADSPLKHAIACMHEQARNNTFIYTALSSNTQPEKIKALEEMGGFFYQLSTGDHMGYIPMNDSPVAPGVAGSDKSSYRDTLDDIAMLNLDTIKMPLSAEAIGLLPFFSQENSMAETLTDKELVNKLADHLGDFGGVLDMSEYQQRAFEDRCDQNRVHTMDYHRVDNGLRNI